MWLGPCLSVRLQEVSVSGGLTVQSLFSITCVLLESLERLHIIMLFHQLFRRVAAALPGMESTTDKANKDDLIEVKLKDTQEEPQPQSGGCMC